jgi:ABC-type transporter MlaC component
MSLFKKEKATIVLTKDTAPKKQSLELKITGNISRNNGWSDVKYIAKVDLGKQMLSNSDTLKESIKEELANELEKLYADICIQIDNSSELSNEFWYNTEIEETTI